jgi:hypothetical protein
MLIVSHIDKDGVASGYYLYGPPTPKSWNQNPSGFKTFKTNIVDGVVRLQLLQDNKPYEIMFKSVDQGRMHYQALLDKRGSFDTLYPVWRLVDAASGKDAADAALSAPPTREEQQGSRPAENGPHYGSKTGAISDGSCACKTKCETGQSRFSPGNSIGACKAQCAAAFSGCTRGEVRSNVRRN